MKIPIYVDDQSSIVIVRHKNAYIYKTMFLNEDRTTDIFLLGQDMKDSL